MAFNISNEQKKSMAEQALIALQSNLYRDILFMGEDPDSFDYEVYRDSTDPVIMVTYKNLFDTDTKIEKLQSLISSLS
jgi:hypothetical protein